MDGVRIPVSGDPFYAASEERPHACNDGWITLGQLGVDPETGDEFEEFAVYLCRRCAEEASS